MYYDKYLKYKLKYIELKNQLGGDAQFISMVINNNIRDVEAKLNGSFTTAQKIGFGKKSNSNQIDPITGKTVLELAIENNKIEMVELLLKYNANIKQNKTMSNKSLLELAIDTNNINMIILLMKKSVEQNDKSSNKIFNFILNNSNISINLIKELINNLSIYTDSLKKLLEDFKLRCTGSNCAQIIDIINNKIKEKEKADANFSNYYR